MKTKEPVRRMRVTCEECGRIVYAEPDGYRIDSTSRHTSYAVTTGGQWYATLMSCVPCIYGHHDGTHYWAKIRAVLVHAEKPTWQAHLDDAYVIEDPRLPLHPVAMYAGQS